MSESPPKITYKTRLVDIPEEQSEYADYGRWVSNLWGVKDVLAGMFWAKRWNYQGWMLRGIEETVWITDKTANLILKGAGFSPPDPR